MSKRLSSWLRELFCPTRPARRASRLRFRPCLEPLEDRLAPAIYAVNTLVDENDGTGVGGVSLRDAIAAANANPGDDTISFDPGVFSSPQTIRLTSARVLELTDTQGSTTITGPAAGVTISGDANGDGSNNDETRVFQVNHGVSASLSGLTIADGSSGFLDGAGGGILNLGTLTLTACTLTGNFALFGGGIFTEGALTLTDCTLVGNTAILGGGGISNEGTLTLTDCTLSGNSATFGNGGGIFNNSSAVAIFNSTLSGNSANFGGGGIFDTGSTSDVRLTNSTLTGNRADSDGDGFGAGGGYLFGGGFLTLHNTIVAGNLRGTGTADDITLDEPEHAVSGSHSLIGDAGTSGGLLNGVNGNIVGNAGVGTLDITTVLDPTLSDNDGPTQTHALVAGSSAIDAGDNNLVPDDVTTDQRGLPRIVNATVDIGAFEVQGANQAPTVSVPGSQTASEDVDRPIGGISVGDPDGGTLTVSLAVGHGTLTLGSSAGLSVSDNGTASVTLSGSVADLNAALATLVYRGGLNYSGTDTLTVTVSDPSLGTSDSVTITVKSAAEQAADLQALVRTLRAEGVLNQGQANALLVKLNLKGNSGDSGKVQAFLNEVAAFANAGLLTPDEASSLLEQAETLLLSLTRR